MRKIILKTLTLTNFKGVRSLSINFFGNTNIYGANEAGKSSIYTAFTWLLTGKDEFDRKDYEIKNTKNKELNSQAHEVEALLEVNSREVKLKRAYFEDWQKPKGQSQKVFKGHYTEYWVDDVPCSAKEYQAKVDDIINPKFIKLVTNPTFFNSLHWEDQRRGLIDIAGAITDTEVIESIATPKNDYGTLIMVLNGGKKLEEWKKELSSKKKLLKDTAVEFQPRIDEAKRSLPEVKDWDKISSEITTHQARVQVIDESIADASKALAEKQKGLLQLQKDLHTKKTELSGIRYIIQSELQAVQNEGANQISGLQRELQTRLSDIKAIEKRIADLRANKSAYELQIESKDLVVGSLRNEWDVINAEKFVFDESKCECPTCNQSLPAEQIEEQKSEMLKNFNNSVISRKAQKVEQSNQVKKEIAQLKETIQTIDAEIPAHEEEIKVLNHNIQAINLKLSERQAAEANKKATNLEAAIDARLKENNDALSIQCEITTLEENIAAETKALSTGDTDNTLVLKSERERLYLQIDALKNELADKAVIERINNRISQLESEEKANSQAIADLELQEFEVESFTRAKMDILEKRVNGMFRYVTFRLFETQVNGGIAETCVCEYKGVPYPTLNTAAKLLAGIDVLTTLSDYYKVYAPVFCDNRESVTFIPETKSQIISLFVSPEDKKLRIETGKEAFALV